MMSSVARKPSHATDDIINYNKKKNNYRKELKELAATNIVEAADDAGPPRAPRAGSLASSENLIRTFLKKKGVTAVDKGVKFGHRTLSFTYDDMLADLTKNVRKTNTNLTSAQHTKLLRELKRTGMPVAYIRSENLRNQYRELDNGARQIPQTSPPAYQSPHPPAYPSPPNRPPSPSRGINRFGFTTTPIRSKKGRPRSFMLDDR
jgi:hypothetical protein